MSFPAAHKALCFLCFLHPPVLHDPSQRCAVPHPSLPAHCFPPILPFVLCFSNFSSFLTNWQEQASVKSAWKETTADSCSYHSATEATWVCTQVMFPEHTRVVLYRADHTLWIHCYLIFQETLLFPWPSPWFYSEFTFIVTEQPEQSLLFTFPIPHQYPQEWLLWPLLTCFSPPDCSLLSVLKLLFKNCQVFYLFCHVSICFYLSFKFSFLSQQHFNSNISHKLLLHMFI